MFSSHDYSQRNSEKQHISDQKDRKKIRTGEIRITKVGINIGNEISKEHPFTRPFLVLKTGIGGDLVYGVFLTTKYREQFSHQYTLIKNRQEYGLQYESYGIINQPKVISKKRLMRLCNNIIVNAKHIPLVELSICDNIKGEIIDFLHV